MYLLRKHLLSSLAILGLVATPALAHSPYLKPNSFNPPETRKHVTVEAAFAEGDLRPDVAQVSDAYHIIAPNGEVTKLSPAATLKDALYLEAPLDGAGTYLISSGLRKGRIANAALKDGEVRFLIPGTSVGEGETPIRVQSLTRADVYITSGKPTKPDFKTQGVELWPVSAPYDAYTGEAFTVQVREDGVPVGGQVVTVIQDGQTYAVTKTAEYDLPTNDKGEVTFTPKEAGLYLLQVRVRRPSPEDASIWNSHTATLTLEVLPQ
ncbi:MAG: DUF4198 domain-containing protein [Asticcacaulis sp.]